VIKLKRVVIKEELVTLTGDFTKAVLLNQFIYWSERVKDFDKFIEEEKLRMKTEGQESNVDKQNGWIYKTTEELSDETMLRLSPQTIRRHLRKLIDNNWIDERQNPKYKWDRTKQYRVNITKIQADLQKLGYSLAGYPLKFEKIISDSRSDNFGDSNFQNGKSKIPKWKIKVNKTEEQYQRLPTEITTETTIRDFYVSPSDRPEATSKIPFEEIRNLFNKLCPSFSKVIKITNKRKPHIRARWQQFKGDMQIFETAFTKLETSDFCKGNNDRRWRASFDWIMANDTNIVKVLEGKYDNRDIKPKKQYRDEWGID